MPTSYVIQFKRGPQAELPTTSTYIGEPYFCTDTGALYIWNGTGMVCINSSTSGSGGSGGSASFAENETPSGTTDGTNQTFTLTHTPVSGSLKLVRNGIRLQLGPDFTLSGNSITMVSAMALMLVGDWALADYRY
jgi:hypothetical protein